MFRITKSMIAGAAILGSIALIGCESHVNSPTVQADDSHLAAYAANATAPTSQPTQSTTVAAELPQSAIPAAVEIVNYSDKMISGGNVWVNGTFVAASQAIPPHGVLNVPLNQFYSKSGDRLDQANVGVTSVQLANSDGYWTLLGPIKN